MVFSFLSMTDPSKQMVLIVTNCSKRKRARPVPHLCARTLSKGSTENLANQWIDRINSEKATVEVSELYCGRQFSLAVKTAKTIHADVYVVSAGLGIVKTADAAPPYSLTVSPGAEDNILSLADEPITAAHWWRALTAQSKQFLGLETALEQRADPEELVLIALPSSYLKMIEGELQHLPSARLAGIRVFAGPSFRFSNPRLNWILMPYDIRLDGAESPTPGTGTDFSARALHDFSTAVLPSHQIAEVKLHADAVVRRTESWTAPRRPTRTRQSDSELIDTIRLNWDVAGSSASRMLKRLRSELGLACEQSRIKRLFAIVEEEKEAPT